jgi:hypothetical protein
VCAAELRSTVGVDHGELVSWCCRRLRAVIESTSVRGPGNPARAAARCVLQGSDLGGRDHGELMLPAGSAWVIESTSDRGQVIQLEWPRGVCCRARSTVGRDQGD